MPPLQSVDHARFANNKGCVDDVMQGLPSSPNPPSSLSFLLFCNPPPHQILPRLLQQFPRSSSCSAVPRFHAYTPLQESRARLVRVSPNFFFALLQQSTRHTVFSPLLNCMHARSFLRCPIFQDTSPHMNLFLHAFILSGLSRADKIISTNISCNTISLSPTFLPCFVTSFLPGGPSVPFGAPRQPLGGLSVAPWWPGAQSTSWITRG